MRTEDGAALPLNEHEFNLNHQTVMKDRKSAFALVIALSLMAFVLLLVLSMVSLIQVETVTATSGREQLKARLNAQLFFQVCIDAQWFGEICTMLRALLGGI